jgi:hypothetical protein
MQIILIQILIEDSREVAALLIPRFVYSFQNAIYAKIFLADNLKYVLNISV